MPTDRSSRPVRKASLITLLAGVALVATYVALRTLDVGKIGDPTDIGGGFILLIGYALTAVGFLMIVLDFVRHRSNRH
jgi:energy-converting hydrogenase Eha subunit C